MIVLIGGVAGSGKSTVGTLLAQRLGWQFIDADSFHSAAAIAKMRSGVPLTDSDREPWLRRIAGWMDQRTAAGESAVGGCSALKQSYRDRLLGCRPEARLVFLTIGREVAAARLTARHGHFFSAKLMDSQFGELEPPGPGPQVLLLPSSCPAGQLAAEIAARLGLAEDHKTGQHPDSPATATLGGKVPDVPQAKIYKAGRQDKPWGHELIFAAVAGKYVGKVIHVADGQSLSLQYHREKDETISVLSGEALIEHGPSAGELRAQRFGPGDTIHLPPGALHRITAVGDLTFAEASTAYPGWREDVVRLEDRYGRTGTTAP